MFDLIILEVVVTKSGVRKGQVAGCSEYNNEPLVLKMVGYFRVTSRGLRRTLLLGVSKWSYCCSCAGYTAINNRIIVESARMLL